MNSFSKLNEIYSEYLLALSDDLMRFLRSKVKVTSGHRGGKCIHVDATLRHQNLSSCVYFVL